MKLLVIADEEFVVRDIPECEVDILISCGDLPEPMIMDAAKRCRCREIFAVKGNHDSSKPFEPPIRDLHLNRIQYQGVAFGGFCGSWRYKPRGNFLFEQNEVEAALKSFPAVDVFVGHNSPRLVHDRDDEVHLGFVAFNNYIARAEPKLFLHGHQHEVVETIVGVTRVVGTFGHRFLTYSQKI